MKLRVFEARLLAGLAAATALLGTAAHAQTPTGPMLGPWPTTTVRPAQPRAPQAAQSIETAPARQPQPVAPIRPAAPDDDPDAPPPNATPASQTEPMEPAEPTMPKDGVMDAAEQTPPADGTDASAVDAREPEEIQAFAPTEPAAGYDPTQFSIETDPLLDRRPLLFARLDPYVPTGIRIGSFLLYPEAEITGAAFSNLLRSNSNPRSDIALETRPAVRLISTWGVHALEFGARGLASFHNGLPSEDDRAWAVDARGRIDITRRTNVEATVAHEVTQEVRGTVNSRSVGERADITTDRAGVAFNQRFNRLTLQLRGAIVEREFGPSVDVNGLPLANSDRDLTQHEAALRATWSFKPQLAVFGEIGADERNFAAPSLADNIRRDSSGERYRMGVAFGNTGEIVRGEAAIGTLKQRFDDQRLPDVSGLIVDANVAWRITGLTSLLVAARSDVGESTLAGSGGALLRSGGVELRHAFRRNLVASAGLRASRADYVGTSIVEQDLTTTAGLEYYLSREVTVFGRYAHVDFNSTAAGSDYTADEVRVGVRVRQ